MSYIRNRFDGQRSISVFSKSNKADTDSTQGLVLSRRLKYTKTPVVNVPREVLRRNRIITPDRQDAVSDGYKILRTQILQKLLVNDWSSLAVTSPGQGDGKTITAINLAVSLAQEVNNTVLLVDLDFRKPSIHKYFEVKPRAGVVDCLLKGKPMEVALFNPGIERLVIMPGYDPIINSSELLSTPKFKKLVEDIKGRYERRIVIYDLPPVLNTDDALAFAPLVDAFLLVIEEGATKKDDLIQAVEMLKESRIIGTVLNKTEDKLSSY